MSLLEGYDLMKEKNVALSAVVVEGELATLDCNTPVDLGETVTANLFHRMIKSSSDASEMIGKLLACACSLWWDCLPS
jgi:hypothetical protein